LREDNHFHNYNLFKIDTASVTRTGGIVSGLETSRTTGISSFTTVESTFAIVKEGRGSQQLVNRFSENIMKGGTTTTSEFSSPGFSKRFSSGGITYSESPTSKGLQFSIDTKQFKPSETTIQSFAKDEVKVARGRNKFINNLETPKIKTNIPEFKPTGKTNILVDKAVKQFESPKLTQTLEKGFQGSKYKSAPFKFQTPKVSRNLLGVATLSTSRTVSTNLFGKTTLTSNIQTKIQKPELIPAFMTGQVSGTKSAFDTGFVTSTFNLTTTTPQTRTPFTPIPISEFGLIGNLPKPNLQFKRPGGVGKFKGGRDYGYIQSFGGWFTGKVGKTKGLMIGGREVYTGLEIRGREVKKKK